MNVPMIAEPEGVVGESETSLVPAGPAALAMPEPILHAVVTEPGQMGIAQQGLIAWCERKIAALTAEREEALANFEIAQKAKWKSAPFKVIADRIGRRMVFYDKIQQALEAGYVIVPNFPCDVFAIRTRRHEPKAIAVRSNHGWGPPRQATQEPEPLPVGAGHYENPQVTQIPEEGEHQRTDGKPPDKFTDWWPADFEEMEFPIRLAHPEVLSATAKAMALRLFDEIAVVPGDGAALTRSRRQGSGDPMVLGRIVGPKKGYQRKRVTFFLAWWMRESDL